MSLFSVVGNVLGNAFDALQGVGALVEDAVTGLTGSEALGDLAGAAFNVATGNYVGAALHAAELGKDLVEAGPQAISVTLHQAMAGRELACGCPGPGRASPAAGWSDAGSSVHPGRPAAAGRLRDILCDPSLSLEDRVAMLLAAVVDGLDEKIEDKMRRLADASDEKGNDFQQLQTELQQLMQKRSQMIGLQSNLMQMFHQTSMQVIGNLR